MFFLSRVSRYAVRQNIFCCHNLMKASAIPISSHSMSTQHTHNHGHSAQKSKLLSEGLSDEWTLIYRFPPISVLTSLNRLKLYQTGFTILGVPTVTMMYLNNMTTLATLQSITVLATVACSVLYAFSYYSRRLIGLIYRHKTEDCVKISRLTFWGNRKDILVPIEDLVPLADGNNNSVSDAYVKVERYSTKEFLIMSIKFGKVLSKGSFEDVFGSLHTFKLMNDKEN